MADKRLKILDGAYPSGQPGPERRAQILRWLKEREAGAFGMSQEMALSPDIRTQYAEWEVEYRDAARAIDASEKKIAVLTEALQRFIPKCARCGADAEWIGSMTGFRMCGEHKRDSSYINEDIAMARAAIKLAEEE